MFFPELTLMIAVAGVTLTIHDQPMKHYITEPQCQRRLAELVTYSTNIQVPYRITFAKCIKVP
jgi:hypothetical protein